MKYLIFSAALFIVCLSSGASGTNILFLMESKVLLGANLTNALFITDNGRIFLEEKNRRYVNPQIVEEAKKTRESLPAKDFPEGNWGETVNGVQVSLRFSKPSCSNQEPINSIVLVRNTSNHVFIFDCSNEVSLGAANYLTWTGSGQKIESKPKYSNPYPSLGAASGGTIIVEPGTQRKYMDRLNDTYDLTNGDYLVQASINAPRGTSSNTVEWIEIKSAKVPIEIR